MALNNNKSILVYGLSIDEKIIINNILEENRLPSYALLEKHMARMKIKDILEGLRFELHDIEMPDEKLILFNGFSDEDLDKLIKNIRMKLGKEPMLAVVTNISMEWDLKTLLSHLIEEKRTQQDVIKWSYGRMKEIMSRIAEKIKQGRIDAGLSQKQLAKKLGVAENFINEVEQGRKVINEALMDKISKILGKDINDISMYAEEEENKKEVVKKEMINTKTSINQKVKTPNKESKNNEIGFIKEVWNAAFGSVLKTVSGYKYDSNEVIFTRQMPLISNKVEGYALDKVLFLEIQEDDMIGFRIAKGDIAFAHLTHEIENNAICLVEYNSQRVLRQIKKLDNNKVLLISNKGTVRTETIYIKELKVLAKLDKVEIKL